MKKLKQKKAAVKKEDKPESIPESSKVEDASETPPEPIEDDVPEKVPSPGSSSHQRQPSLSSQSKLRSSSFRQAGGVAPLSPGYGFPEGDTAPEIYRKQAMKIEELEKENKRLAKEALEGEKRWKKAEEELEELREAEDDTQPSAKVGTVGESSSEELLKLV